MTSFRFWGQYLWHLLAFYGAVWLTTGLLAVAAITAYVHPIAALGFICGLVFAFMLAFYLRLIRDDARGALRERQRDIRRSVSSILMPHHGNPA